MSSPAPCGQPAQHLSSFAQTLRDADDKFYEIFPAAKQAAEKQQASYNAGYFGGISVCYDAQRYGAGYDQGHITVSSQSSPHQIPSPPTSHLTGALHFDYLARFEPGTRSAPMHNSYDPVVSESTSYSDRDPEDPNLPTQVPALQLAIPGIPPQISSEHFLDALSEISLGISYLRPGTHPIVPSPPLAQSPIEAISPISFDFPPDTPSEVASSPISDFDDFYENGFQPIVVPSQNPRRPTHHRHYHHHRMQSPSRGQNFDLNRMYSDNTDFPSTQSAPLSHPNQSNNHGSDRHHSHSTTHIPHRLEKASIRGTSWDPQGPQSDNTIRSSRKSMRLSPLPSNGQLEKKPPLACLFCRGRKIACRRPLPGSIGQTCNQCQRRSLHCEWPTESRRGMTKKKATESTDVVDQGLIPSANAT